MNAAPDKANLVASLKKRAEFLAAAASMDVNGAAPTDMDAAVRGILSRSSELLRAAASLGSDGNPIALELMARALLENLITILWVLLDAAHPDHLEKAAVAELSRMARVNLKTEKARVMNRKTGEDATAEFLASDRFKTLPRRMSVEDRAKQAGVEDLYNIFYRSLSMGVHGQSLGSGDPSLELTVMHMQGVGAIALATGHSGVRWLVHRERTDNETLRKLLGLGGEL